MEQKTVWETVDRASKERLMEVFQSPQYQPMKIKELAILLGVPKEERHRLQAVADALLQEGKISLSRKGKYGIAQATVFTGTFSGTQKGYGFVKLENSDEDIFIGKNDTGTALHGDTVQGVLITEHSDFGKTSRGHRQEGRIVRVLHRNTEQVVGTFVRNKHYGFVISDNTKLTKDVFIDEKYFHGAVDGHKVVAKLISYGGDHKNPEGEIIEILGHKDDPGVDILSVVRAHELPIEFPEAVWEQLKTLPLQVTEKDWEDRRDFRNLQTVTIDGEDAKDLDDAITLSENEKGYLLGVHIADVSHYVKEDTPLDTEARKRGTSVYLVDRVIPMLPHQLSNGICSLNAGEDRLTLSCMMQLDKEGNITDHEIVKSVIRVDRRMSYPVVAKLLQPLQEETDEQYIKLQQEYQDFLPFFQRMLRLSQILREKRRKRGALSFDFPESKIILDDRGKPKEIIPYERNCATMLIEDFMLIANETIAEDFFWRSMPFLYRNHEKPDEEKMLQFAAFASGFGQTLHVRNQEIHPKKLQQLLERVEGTQEEFLIHRVLLRSMKQARYSEESLGHFGLAARYYTHFTSPIRRYPDLQIHRIIKEVLTGEMDAKREEHYRQLLPEVAQTSSRTERRAEETEREVVKRKKAQYMKKHIGAVYEGIISSITAWGMYVELPNTVEGLIRAADMTDDYYVYDEAHYRMVGEVKRKEYTLGQRVKIRVEDAEVETGTVSFVLADSKDWRW